MSDPFLQYLVNAAGPIRIRVIPDTVLLLRESKDGPREVVAAGAFIPWQRWRLRMRSLHLLQAGLEEEAEEGRVVACRRLRT